MSNFSKNAFVDEPEQVPIRHAATVMIVDERPDLQVLMVQRTSRAVFGASAWVFPGGRVDPTDATELDDVTHGLSDADASAMLEVAEHGRAWWFAGLRETLEEVGLLIGAGGAADHLVDHARAAVQADATVFAQTLRDDRLRLDLTELHEVARFVTPLGPPRRFDTRFFVAAAPAGQEPSPDEEEVVRHEWVRPREAIDRWRQDDFPLMSVTHRMLSCLSRYPSVDELLTRASTRGPQQRVRVNDPDGAYHVLLPGEPGYETAELEIEHGWVRI